MKELFFDYSKASAFVSEEALDGIKIETMDAVSRLRDGSGPGADFLGWIDLPVKTDQEFLELIRQSAEKIQNESEVLVVIGIGGSYLGARAAIEFLKPSFYNQLPKAERDGVEIYFAGHHLDCSYLTDLVRVIGDRDFSVNVISKSGTTTEPAIAFRFFKKLLEEKYGKTGAVERIYVTTDQNRGALKAEADEYGYQSFVIPNDIGGRYSVLTAVGLLPMAAAGIDIESLIEGAKAMRQSVLEKPFEENPALQYAAFRNLMWREGKRLEILANYASGMHSFAEWWKQLFGESEGKDHKGIFPAAYDLTTDLHSIGQYIQDGPRVLFETVLDVETAESELVIEKEADNADGLNYLAGCRVDEINRKAMLGTILAHTDGGVPNLIIKIPQKNAYYLGQLFYFFEYACSVSGYLLRVNPFDQPGVEAYKRNMFALLGKPGYESEQAQLMERLSLENGGHHE